MVVCFRSWDFVAQSRDDKVACSMMKKLKSWWILMIFNIFKKVSIFVDIHILKASCNTHITSDFILEGYRGIQKIQPPYWKGIHISVGIWVFWRGTGGYRKYSHHIGKGYTYHYCICIRGYTFYGVTHITVLHISRCYTYHSAFNSLRSMAPVGCSKWCRIF